MLDIFKKIWKLSEKRHGSLVRGLVISFIRSIFGLTQIFAIMLTIKVLMEEAQVDRSAGYMFRGSRQNSTGKTTGRTSARGGARKPADCF